MPQTGRTGGFASQDSLAFRSLPPNISGSKIIISLFAILIIFGGVGAGTLLTSKNQNIERKAALNAERETMCTDPVFIMVSLDGKNPQLNLKLQPSQNQIFIHSYSSSKPCYGNLEFNLSGNTSNLQTDKQGITKLDVDDEVIVKVRASSSSTFSNEISVNR